jgi:hypothetical protein
MTENKFKESEANRIPGANSDKNKGFFMKMSPQIQKEMDLLKKQEDKILKGLKDEEMQRLFIKNPFEALSKMNVEVPSIIKGRLKQMNDLSEIFSDKEYVLSNGQTITPKIKINFTKMKEE